jgi:hypothetical protein
MKALVSTLGICAMALFAMGGCGSDDDDGGGGGSGNTGGSGGSTGGSGGSTGGSGGSTGGSAGSSTGGTAGSATGGSAGSATGGTAGAAGGGAGLSCAAYCALMEANCTGANAEYDNTGECTTECGGWAEGTAADTTGNTLGCHTYHATAAAGDPGTHCPHAGPTGGGVCVD